MAIWDSEVQEIPPFDEEWLDPFDEGSLFDTNIYSQLFRSYNWINREIGVDAVCGTTNRPNLYVYPHPGALPFPTSDQIALTPTIRLPLGQYINYTAQMLGNLFNELNIFCTYYASGDGTGEQISSVFGFDVSDDRYWNIYDPEYDTSSNYRNSLIEIIEEVDEKLLNPLAKYSSSEKPIVVGNFNLKCNWGKIVKILQRGQELFKFKKSRAYVKRRAGFSIEYVTGSSEYPFENFSYIQKSGEEILYTNQGETFWVYLDKDDDYMFPGNNGHNFCPTQKTQYSNADIHALPSWETDIYAYNMFRTGENRADWAGFTTGNWAVSGFDSQAGSGHPLGSQMYFFTTYRAVTSQGNCSALVTYEAGYQPTYTAVTHLRNVGWFKMGGSRRQYRLKMVITGVPNYVNQVPIATIKVVPQFRVTPSVAGREITTTGNEFTWYNGNQTGNMTVTAELTGDAYLAQPIFPLPSPGHPRTYGARIEYIGMKYYVNGKELIDDFGRSTPYFSVYMSPCGKVYLDTTSI